MLNTTRLEARKRRLTTPRAAAAAGIIFGVFFIAAEALIHLAVPTNPADAVVWLQDRTDAVALALNLVPFGGLAFLWFMGVARDRLGAQEDQFFATVLLGSGLLYLAMTFFASAFAGGLLASYNLLAAAPSDAAAAMSRQTMYQITNVFGVRMAGVFMLTSATIWVRTDVMPRWLALVTYVLALALLIIINLSVWVTLVFPAWVLVVSIMILIDNYRRRTNEQVVAPSAR